MKGFTAGIYYYLLATWDNSQTGKKALTFRTDPALSLKVTVEMAFWDWGKGDKIRHIVLDRITWSWDQVYNPFSGGKATLFQNSSGI